ncbi:MAG: CBS domain-containing protein [Thiobacillus sp.]
MFSIHGMTGQIFQGTIEQLAQQVPLVNSIRHVRGINREGDEFRVPGNETGPREAPVASPHEDAMAAYREAQPGEQARAPLHLARQLMHAPVVTARSDEPVERLWRRLIEHAIRQLPILDAKGHLVGLVSDRDLLTAFNVEHGRIRDVQARTAADVMRQPIVAAGPDTDIRRIARVMLEYNQSGVPILDEESVPMGLVSRGDILRAVANDPPLSVWA